MVTRITWFLPALIIAGSAYAQTITGVSGTVAHGQAITISGSGFGTKSPAAPLVFEDFSDGSASPLVSNGNSSLILNDTTFPRSSFHTQHTRCDYRQPYEGCTFAYNVSTADRWFVQYWVRVASNWRFGTTTYGGGDDGLSNVKFLRFFPTGARNYSNVGYAFHGFAGNQTSRFTETGYGSYRPINLATLITPGAWHAIQAEFIENSGVDQADGVLRLWIDGALVDETTTWVTNVGSDGTAVNKRPFVIGFYDSWAPSDDPVPNMYNYYSDIYVDNTLARVEIGNASSYNSCTLREIQAPTSWSDTSITVNVRQGLLTNGQTAYVFVVDRNGNKSSGFPVMVGQGGSPRRRLMLMGIGVCLLSFMIRIGKR